MGDVQYCSSLQVQYLVLMCGVYKLFEDEYCCCDFCCKEIYSLFIINSVSG